MPHPGIETLARLLVEPTDTLHHVLTCPRCRRLLLSALDYEVSAQDLPVSQEGGSAASAFDHEESAHDLPAGLQGWALRPLDPNGSYRPLPPLNLQFLTERILQGKSLADENLRRDRGPAAVLFDELLDRPVHERAEFLTEDRRFEAHGHGLASILLDAVKDTEDPRGQSRLARLALIALQRTSADSSLTPRLQARAYDRLAEAHRRLGHLDTADEMLRAAQRELRDQPLGLTVRAEICRTLAALRVDQGFVDEALGLLSRAAEIASQTGDDLEFALACTAQGWILFDEIAQDEAHPAFHEALSILTPDHGEAYLSALHGLALTCADLGRLGEVLHIRNLLAVLPFLDDTRNRWISARLDWQLGDSKNAIAELRLVFLDFVAQRSAINALLTGLELARWFLERDSAPPDQLDLLALDQIRQRLGPLFDAGLVPHHLWDAVGFALWLPQLGSGHYMEAILQATRYVEKAQFNAALAFHPIPEPDAKVSWKDLEPARRHAMAEAAGRSLTIDFETVSPSDQNWIAWTHEARTFNYVIFPRPQADQRPDRQQAGEASLRETDPEGGPPESEPAERTSRPAHADDEPTWQD
jgi:tetratricopeptide (TPR) repeat protein